MPDRAIRILVVDDHTLVRKSIASMLSKEPDMEVVGLAENGRDAVQFALDLDPDVIVMDVSMPEMDGIRATGAIKSLDNSAKIIMISMHHNNTLIQQARKNGASGYIIKQKANSDLIPAIRAAYSGQLSL